MSIPPHLAFPDMDSPSRILSGADVLCLHGSPHHPSPVFATHLLFLNSRRDSSNLNKLTRCLRRTKLGPARWGNGILRLPCLLHYEHRARPEMASSYQFSPNDRESIYFPFSLTVKTSRHREDLFSFLSHGWLPYIPCPTISSAPNSRDTPFICRVLGRFLLYFSFIIVSVIIPYKRFSGPAFAAPPVHMEASKVKVDKYLVAEDELERFEERPDGLRNGRKAKEREVEDIEAEFSGRWPSLLNFDANVLQEDVEGSQIAFDKLSKMDEKNKAAMSRFGQEEVPPSSSTESDDNIEKEQISEGLKGTLPKIWDYKYMSRAVDVQDAQSTIDEQTMKLIESARRDEMKLRVLQAEVDKTVKEVFQILKENLGLETGADESIVKTYRADKLQHDSRDSDKQVLKVTSLDLALAWRKWREGKKVQFKQLLLNNAELGQKFVEEEILRARDRVVAGTWYDDKNKRWEMLPEVVGYAVTKDLVECARVRHDEGMMYLTLKGDDREYYVNLPLFDVLFEKAGGFDALHNQMLVHGVPTTFEVMRIPFNEWDPVHLFLLPFRMCYFAISSIWQSGLLYPVKTWYFSILNRVVEELMIRFGFPLLERFPKQARMALGLQFGDGAAAAEITPMMEWKMKAQKNVELRYDESSGSTSWWISLPVRCFIAGVPLAFLFRLVARIVRVILGPAEHLNEVQWKEKIEEKMMKQVGSDEKELMDPVKKVFERMKRIKRPDVSLKDFDGLKSIKEETKEIVTFLQSPAVFKQMGARPPRGVLITGEPGTGKTSLALAIAAEARVPMVEVQGLDLEGGAWVGQGAANVRELFKIARELAPLIIFIDDFDYFAGIRGETRDSRKQDHEALINQLLVELDGFETQEGVVLMATSSRPWTIDDALRRPGRMDRTIALPMPNMTEREVILHAAAEKTMDPNLMGFVDWREVARKTDGMTPRQLNLVPPALEASFATGKHTDDEELFSMFVLLATLNKITPEWIRRSKWVRNWKEGLIDWLDLRITKVDVESVIDRIDIFGETKPGLDLYSPPFVWTREFKYPHAVWAAGRGLIALLLPNFDLVEQLWLNPTSWDGIGFTRFTKMMEAGYEETRTTTRSYYEKQLVVCFGSYIAGCLLLPFGETNNLSRFEFEEAQKIACSMVLEFGWGPDDSHVVYKSPSKNLTVSLGEELEYKLDAKIEKVFNTACERALEMLQKNRGALEALLEHLLQYDSVSKKDMWKILKNNGAIMEEEPFMLFPHANGEHIGLSTNGRGSVTSLALSSGTNV